MGKSNVGAIYLFTVDLIRHCFSYKVQVYWSFQAQKPCTVVLLTGSSLFHERKDQCGRYYIPIMSLPLHIKEIALQTWLSSPRVVTFCDVHWITAKTSESESCFHQHEQLNIILVYTWVIHLFSYLNKIMISFKYW